MLRRTESSPHPGQLGYPREGTGFRGSGSHLPAHALPRCAWAAQTGWQENPSWFRAMHLAGCSNAWGGACAQEGREHTLCQLQGRHQITLQLPLCRSGLHRNRLQFPRNGSGILSPFPEHSPSAVYIIAGVVSSKQLRSPF